MPLHILKLCVGADTIADLEAWIAMRLSDARRAGQPPEHRHTTRMVPKRIPELLDGGSLYWVIKGQVAARQRIEDVRPFKGEDGVGRCHLVLDPEVVEIETRPCRPFQGWRYMTDSDAPVDLSRGHPDVVALPPPLRRELRELGLI